MAELVYAFDLKSNGEIHMGSSPISGTRLFDLKKAPEWRLFWNPELAQSLDDFWATLVATDLHDNYCDNCSDGRND